MRRLVVALAVGLMGLAQEAVAQDYRFSVPTMDMQVLVQPDASAKIVYDITFQNNPVGHTIDVVDIGTPQPDYNLKNVQASSGGQALRDIRVSEYVKPGFEVHMGARAIRPGQTGSLHVEFTMPNMVYQDTTRSDYASFRITPTWFGAKYVQGATRLRLAVHLPQGVKPEEVLHQGLAFQQKVLTPEGASVVWQWPATRLTEQHLVGVSFPKRVMERVVKKSNLDLLMDWFRNSPRARVIVGVIIFVMFGIAFFRFTGGTGMSVFVVLSLLLIWWFVVSPGWELIWVPLSAILLVLNEWGLTRRRAHYMPAIAQVEGGGIKRGLTAPEAAVLLELPLGRVLGLVIFGMLKKGMIRQVLADPLAVEIDKTFEADATEADKPDDTTIHRQGTVVHRYERPFLYLIQKNPGKPVREISFAIPMRKLVQETAARMKGFDLSQTKSYYQAIVRRAVKQADAVGDIQQRQEQIDRNFEWILLDDDYPTVFHRGGYWPIWSRGQVWTTSGSAPSGTPSLPGQTTFGDVASSFAGWTENTMGSLAGSISPGSLRLPQASGGFLNLSGADRLTGQFFEAISEASSHGGGGGGGGCACAGCACACACAGGGR